VQCPEVDGSDKLVGQMLEVEVASLMVRVGGPRGYGCAIHTHTCGGRQEWAQELLAVGCCS
jgi:hypothetical protein